MVAAASEEAEKLSQTKRPRTRKKIKTKTLQVPGNGGWRAGGKRKEKFGMERANT